MRNKLVRQAGEYLKSHKKKRHAFAALSLACVIIAATVYGALSMPAISMAKKQPKLEAVRTSALFGETIEVRVSAEAPQGIEPYTFVLHTVGNGAALSSQYFFDETDSCQVEAEGDTSLALHRERRPNGVTNYWFTLDAGESIAFPLAFEGGSWIAPDA